MTPGRKPFTLSARDNLPPGVKSGSVSMSDIAAGGRKTLQPGDVISDGPGGRATVIAYPVEAPGLQVGDEITCSSCGGVCLRVTESIPYGAPLSSAGLAYPDGQPVEYLAPLECTLCHAKFSTIDTTTRRTK